ncbi:MAG: GAF domain-containing protein, partial [Spirochaetales bacterium]|nr:GAF domain-containing protein [Spirochaetales bacterium]
MCMDENRVLKLSEDLARQAALFEDDADLTAFLEEAVILARDYTGSAAAAVFLYEHSTAQLAFKAGASADVDRKPEMVRFGLDENIIGRAFQEGRILLENVSEPTPPDIFRSKLVVPVHHGPDKVGVIVFGHQDQNYYTREDGQALRGLASQFGSILENASPLLRSEDFDRALPRFISGQTASAGAAVGTALLFEAGFETVSSVPKGEQDLELFDESLRLTLLQLRAMETDENSPVQDMAALIFSAYTLMLNDDGFTGKMRNLIIEGLSAESAIRTVVNEYTLIFVRMKEVRLAEKAQDVRDLGYRLIRNLDSDSDEGDFRGQIAIARHIYPSDLIRLAVQNVAGIVLMGGGVTAHISILARTLDLPVMITHNGDILNIDSGSLVVLDATAAR